MLDLNRYTSPRINPSQLRGKERIRLILSTALRLFAEVGIDHVTTTDIAVAGNIPIGSVYRYFQNKEEIIMAITDLQVEDVIKIFEDIAANPLLSHLSWEEVMMIITEAWTQHVRLNDTAAFLYFLRCNQELAARVESRWRAIREAFTHILKLRNKNISEEQAIIYIQLTWSAVELGISRGEAAAVEASKVIALHLEKNYA